MRSTLSLLFYNIYMHYLVENSLTYISFFADSDIQMILSLAFFPTLNLRSLLFLVNSSYSWIQFTFKIENKSPLFIFLCLGCWAQWPVLNGCFKKIFLSLSVVSCSFEWSFSTENGCFLFLRLSYFTQLPRSLKFSQWT